MSLLITGGKKVDKYYANQLLKYFCHTLDSGKYDDKQVIDAAVKALAKISTEDKAFAETFLNILRKKYPNTSEFQQIPV